ncbi:MAG: hypothetical protein JOZ38_06370 [Candidatus Eremiobacteraeota bacterium]|nr:hypothetical protein [Candidatus Eremiobacteraeota bacterium]
MKFTILISTLALSVAMLRTPAAQAVSCNTSIFGTIHEVQPGRILISEVRQGGYEYVTTSRVRLNGDGLSLRPGVFVGAYGCFTPNRALFEASELTLSTTPYDYPGYARHVERLTGTVLRTDPHRGTLVQTGYPHGDVYLVKLAPPPAGTTLVVDGTFNPDGSFDVQHVIRW